jgi:hypothetical protein
MTWSVKNPYIIVNEYLDFIENDIEFFDKEECYCECGSIFDPQGFCMDGCNDVGHCSHCNSLLDEDGFCMDGCDYVSDTEDIDLDYYEAYVYEYDDEY